MGKRKYNQICENCNEEYLSQKQDSKCCSRSCSTKLRHKLGTINTENMVKACRKWHIDNPEKSKEMSINNLPKDNNLEKNGNWKGGKPKEYKEYRIKNYNKYYHWRKTCLDRDGYKCKLCGDINNLQVNHIIPISESKRTAWLRMNGVTLCKKCHYENDSVWKEGERFDTSEAFGNTNIICKVIRSEFQEYPTCGNYNETEDGLMVFFIFRGSTLYVSSIFVSTLGFTTFLTGFIILFI